MSLSYTTTRKTVLTFGFNYSGTQSTRNGPPPVSPASSDTLVPAAFNPFGQDVEVGLVHLGFGPVVDDSAGRTARFYLGASGLLPHAWKWSARLGQGHVTTDRDTRDLDPARFAAALAASDPALRFNPFVATSAANTALYPTLAVHRLQDTSTDSSQFTFRAEGPAGNGFGAGPVQLNFSSDASVRTARRQLRNLRGVPDADTQDYDGNYGGYGSAEIPFLAKKPGCYKLNGSVSAGYNGASTGSESVEDGAGLTWSPVKSWLFRLSFYGGYSTPGQVDNQPGDGFLTTLVDPRRNPAIAENVQVIAHSATFTDTQRRHSWSFSTAYEPGFLKGLQASASYWEQWQEHAGDSEFEPQDVVDNEALLAGRVVRAAPTALDLALGQPGAILSVDATPAALARQVRRNLNLSVDYRSPDHPWGRVSLGVNASWVLANHYELARGQPFVSSESPSANPPPWQGGVRAQWEHGGWSASASVRHVAATGGNTAAARSDVGAVVAYRFPKPVWGTHGKGLRLQLRALNLVTNRPPYADTILGYRGGSALGTTVSFSAEIPL